MKSNFFVVFAISLIAILVSCQSKNDNSDVKEKETDQQTKNENLVSGHAHLDWSYEGESGPHHWAELEANSSCGGSFQSPVNIVNYKTDAALKPIEFHYTKETILHDVINNGHTIQYDFEPGDYVVYNDKTFHLKQFHFHEPAEHTVDGVRFPLAIHLVHQDENSSYLVIEVLVKEGKSSEPFTFLESFLPIAKGETKLVNQPFDMNLNLPTNKGYFTYKGSLTTPPCTEGVRWIIFKESITVSLEQVELLKYLMPIRNFREEQPIHGRRISETVF